LAGFLDNIALYTDLDSQTDADNCVTMMTMHSAKGLEFPYVFVVGMEDGLFPGNRAMGDAEEMEEERRLCYVAMTRAKEKLTMTNARQRTLYGRTTPAMASRFLNEIPEENMEWLSKPEPRPAVSRWEDWSDDAPVTYSQMPTAAPKKPMAEAGGLKKKPAAAAPMLQLKAGESIVHDAFGNGMVLSVRPMGNDALIEVAFDKVGTKKLMLKAAGSHIKKV
jgi:DNA helicase-2/ATP-dependent DNA helicase PcrA